MTGAGISTESGIPDYRSEKVGRYARSNHKPVEFQEFMNVEFVRRKYWARSYVAWPKFSSVLPNLTHKKLAEWEQRFRLHWLITQNIDCLHRKAGSRRLTELHGNAYSVSCVNCNKHWDRHDFQKYVQELNANWDAQGAEVAPDGDIDLPPEAEASFTTPYCSECGGIVKPDIIFFGEMLPIEEMRDAYMRVDEADAMLILGSSLEVLSGYRFAHQMFEQRRPVLIVNIGVTRADEMATVKVSSKCTTVMELIDDM
uniref:Deacetylase sirtuin-type domain-containing protein n=1 Tax=Trichuris muris TaxID=70415 RepID=A0A5S6QTP0_TRIMR